METAAYTGRSRSGAHNRVAVIYEDGVALWQWDVQNGPFALGVFIPEGEQGIDDLHPLPPIPLPLFLVLWNKAPELAFA